MLSVLVAGSLLGTAPLSTNPAMWQRLPDHVRLEGSSPTPNIRVELTVDTNGDPIHCNVLQSDEAKGFDNRFCIVPMRHAHFRPARDEGGQTVVGVFSTDFRYRTDRGGHGPRWSDYTLTVSALPSTRQFGTIARVVTDDRGRVETCAIDQSSGDARLDDLACRYTRSSLMLAAPFDRDGRPVRAMRLVSIGFSTAGLK